MSSSQTTIKYKVQMQEDSGEWQTLEPGFASLEQAQQVLTTYRQVMRMAEASAEFNFRLVEVGGQ